MKIGVSSCLIGNMCRYDGATSKDKFVVDILKKYFDVVAYCPEEAVFGTPRESISLKDYNGTIKVITNFTKIDVTNKLQTSSANIINKMKNDDLCGFVLKSKSPSCGLERVKLYQGDTNFCEKKAVGIFANDIQTHFPYLPLEEEEGRLNDPWLKENFLMQVFAYEDLFEFLATQPTFNDLVQFHTSYKYLIYAKSQKSYKELGSIVANHDKLTLEQVLATYKTAFLEAISQKGNIKKTYNVLLHIFGYFKKLITKDEKKDILATIEEFKEEIIPLITVIKIFNLYVNRFDITYLKTQKFLNPYPKELSLRSDIKAFKS